MSGMPLQHSSRNAAATRASVRWFIATAALESVGDSAARALLPIVAVSVLGAGTATVGVINSLGLLAFLVLSMPVGVLADRWSNPTRMMTASSVVRAAVTLGGVAAWLAGWLQGLAGLGLLLLMAVVVGVTDVAYTAGQGLLVPRLVEPDRIRSVFGTVQAVAQGGGAAGPALLTGLLAVVAAPVAWVASSIMYLASAVTQRRIEPLLPGPPASPRTTMWAQARTGVGHVFSQPTLARVTLANTFDNAAVMAANTLLPVIALRELGLEPAAFAAIAVVGALAGIAGAATASALTSRIGLRATRLVTSAAMILGVVVLLAGTVVDVLPGPSALWLALQAALAGSGASIAMVAGSDLAPRLVPADVLGTVMGAQRALVLGIMPVAALFVGGLGAVAGVPAAVWTWLALAAASAVPCITLEDPFAAGPQDAVGAAIHPDPPSPDC